MKNLKSPTLLIWPFCAKIGGIAVNFLMPKRTYQPKKKRRLRRLGFRARMATPGGKNIIKRRRTKKRTSLSVSDEVRSNKNKRFSRIR